MCVIELSFLLIFFTNTKSQTFISFFPYSHVRVVFNFLCAIGIIFLRSCLAYHRNLYKSCCYTQVVYYVLSEEVVFFGLFIFSTGISRINWLRREIIAFLWCLWALTILLRASKKKRVGFTHAGERRNINNVKRLCQCDNVKYLSNFLAPCAGKKGNNFFFQRKFSQILIVYERDINLPYCQLVLFNLFLDKK